MLTEILEVKCNIGKYQIAFAVSVEYGYVQHIGGNQMSIRIGTCLIKSYAPLNLFIDMGDTIYSIIHQALYQQYDFKDRFAKLSNPASYTQSILAS